LKLADHSKDVLENGPKRIMAAIEGAASVAAVELSAIPDKLLAATKAAQAQLSAASAQTSVAAQPLDGAQVVSELRAAVPPPLARIRAAVDEAFVGSEGLASRNGSINALTGTATTAVQQAAAAPSVLASLLPNLKTHLDIQKAYPSRVDVIAARAADVASVVQGYGDSLLSGSLGPAHADALRPKLEQAKGNLQSFHDGLLADLKAADADLDAASNAIDAALSGVLSSLPTAKRSILDPLTSSQVSLQEAKSAIVEESKSTAAGLSGACEKVEPELATLQQAVTSSEERLKAAGAEVGGSATQASAKTQAALTVLDALDATVQSSVDAINAALGKVPHEADTIKALIARINEQAEAAKASLMTIPDNFTAIDSQIAAAVATIQGAKDGIPAMAAQAEAALTTAESSMDSASTLCDSAIATCTKYMMQAPLLIPARLLFVGVKATIPAIKVAIVAAKGGISTASAAACKLMDVAASVVTKLQPVLVHIVEKLKLAVGALVTLVGTLQQTLVAAVSSLDKVVTTLQAAFSSIPPRIDVILEKIRTQVMAQEAKSKPAPTIQKTQQDVDALAEQTFRPIQEQLDSGVGGVGAKLKAAETDIQAAAVPVAEGIDGLSALTTQLSVDVNQAGDDFMAIIRAAVGLMTQIREQAKAHQTAVSARIEAHFQAALMEIGQLHDMAVSVVMTDAGSA
jgi:hypothetical protein